MAGRRSFTVRFGIAGVLPAILVLVLAFGVSTDAAGQAAPGGKEATVVPGSAVPSASPADADVRKFGLVAAALAFGLGALGAGFAIANVGSAAMGAIGEKPEIAGQALIFIALAEGLVVFGFITALMILGKI